METIYLETSKFSWPSKHCHDFHRTLIEKNWEFHKKSNAVDLKRSTSPNSTVLGARDFFWDSDSVSHLLKRTVTGSTIQDVLYLLGRTGD